MSTNTEFLTLNDINNDPFGNMFPKSIDYAGGLSLKPLRLGQGDTLPDTEIDEESINSEVFYDEYPIPKYEKIFSKVSDAATPILRTHYSKELITLLAWLSENHEPNTPNSSNHINKLLKLIKEYTINYSYDPFCSFLLSIFDGLSYNNEWVTIDKEKFFIISNYIKVLNNQEIDYKIIDKYISKLDELGLNITPY